MSLFLPTDDLVTDVIEHEVRKLMAARVALTPVWMHRAQRDQIAGDIDRMLDQWNELNA